MSDFMNADTNEKFEDGELDWDADIENDGPEFTLLPEGDYDFTVIDFERGRHNGSEKLPACNKAIVHLKIETPEGMTIIRHNLFLHTKTEGMLCAFFAAIGMRKKGERLKMNWNAVPGSRGRAKVGIRTYNDKQYNEIKHFYEYEPGRQPAAAAQPRQTSFETGKF